MQLFRRLIPEDWEYFKQLEQEAFPEQESSKENFLQVVEKAGFIGYFVMDEFIGYLKIRIMKDYGHLAQIAIKKSEWEKGYGSKMMEFVIDYFEKNDIKKAGLYVEKTNERAINLYKKFGFEYAFESWHYWINEKFIKEIEKNEQLKDTTNLRMLDLDDYNIIISTFPEVNIAELEAQLVGTAASLTGDSIPLGLFKEDKLKVYGRFSPNFPGCRPFLCTDIKYVDPFLDKLQRFRKKEYVRLTFDRNKELANLFEKRGYKLYYRLHVMEKKMM